MLNGWLNTILVAWKTSDEVMKQDKSELEKTWTRNGFAFKTRMKFGTPFMENTKTILSIWFSIFTMSKDQKNHQIL